MIEAFRRFVVGGDGSGDRDRRRPIRGHRARRAVSVELLEGRMLLTGFHPNPIALTPAQFMPPPNAQQEAAVDLFATLGSVRGSGSLTTNEIGKVQRDISLIFLSASPSRETVTTFLADYRAATVGHTLNSSDLGTLNGDLSAMLGSANLSIGQFRRFVLNYPASIGANTKFVAIDPSFNDVKSIMANGT